MSISENSAVNAWGPDGKAGQNASGDETNKVSNVDKSIWYGSSSMPQIMNQQITKVASSPEVYNEQTINGLVPAFVGYNYNFAENNFAFLYFSNNAKLFDICIDTCECLYRQKIYSSLLSKMTRSIMTFCDDIYVFELSSF